MDIVSSLSSDSGSIGSCLIVEDTVLDVNLVVIQGGFQKWAGLLLVQVWWQTAPLVNVVQNLDK